MIKWHSPGSGLAIGTFAYTAPAEKGPSTSPAGSYGGPHRIADTSRIARRPRVATDRRASGARVLIRVKRRPSQCFDPVPNRAQLGVRHPMKGRCLAGFFIRRMVAHCVSPGRRGRPFAAEEPVDAVSVGKVTVGAEGHVAQVVQEAGVSVGSQLVEHLPQVRVCAATEIQANGVALARDARPMLPVSRRDLDRTMRHAYYPGAADRHAAFVAAHPGARLLGGRGPEGSLPWTLLAGVDPASREDICFTTEAFCSLMAETALPAADPSSSLTRRCGSPTTLCGGRCRPPCWSTPAPAATQAWRGHPPGRLPG